jgi:RES domain-containing protein
MGSKIQDSRWNRKGDAVIYTLGTPVLALVEVFNYALNAFLKLN